MRGQTGNILAIQQDRSGIRFQRTGDHRKKGCFTGAIRADQGGNTAVRDVETALIDGLKTAKRFRYGLNGYHIFHFGGTGPSPV